MRRLHKAYLIPRNTWNHSLQIPYAKWEEFWWGPQTLLRQPPSNSYGKIRWNLEQFKIKASLQMQPASGCSSELTEPLSFETLYKNAIFTYRSLLDRSTKVDDFKTIKVFDCLSLIIFLFLVYFDEKSLDRFPLFCRFLMAIFIKPIARQSYQT